MSAISTFLATADQMRRMDELAIKREKIPGRTLMENAGAGAARGMLDAGLPDGPVVILCGPGNNGGDGFVVARHLVKAGRRVTILLAANPDKLTGDALLNFDRLPVTVAVIGVRDDNTQEVQTAIASAAVIVDALLGTGLQREVTGRLAELIRLSNEHDALRIAVDIPSGLSSDTGQIMGIAFRAHMTFTFGLFKLGQLMFPAAEYCGMLSLVDIGIPEHVMQEVGAAAQLLTESRAREAMSPRSENSHKGHYGHLLVLAGSPGMSGAAMLTTQAALRSGVGLVTAVVDPVARAAMAATMPEAMNFCFEDKLKLKGKLEALLQFSRNKSAIVCGPGWGHDEEQAALMTALLEERTDIPVVLDADALNLLGESGLKILHARSEKGGVTVLTPHPGEAARLLGTESRAIQADRAGAGWRLAKETGAIVVLKGAHTVVTTPEGGQYVCPYGNAGLATGGTGDVLAGLLGGILASGVSVSEGVLQGVCAHSVAGDLAARESGQRGLIAGDLVWTIGSVWSAWEAGQDALTLNEAN
jgi:NAD(P)H-hydrate epimerase